MVKLLTHAKSVDCVQLRTISRCRSALHIFSAKRGDPATVARIQAVADRNIERFGLLDGEEDKEMIILSLLRQMLVRRRGDVMQTKETMMSVNLLPSRLT